VKKLVVRTRERSISLAPFVTGNENSIKETQTGFF
jgi:hypothetical protein